MIKEIKQPDRECSSSHAKLGLAISKQDVISPWQSQLPHPLYPCNDLEEWGAAPDVHFQLSCPKRRRDSLRIKAENSLLKKKEEDGITWSFASDVLTHTEEERHQKPDGPHNILGIC